MSHSSASFPCVSEHGLSTGESTGTTGFLQGQGQLLEGSSRHSHTQRHIGNWGRHRLAISTIQVSDSVMVKPQRLQRMSLLGCMGKGEPANCGLESQPVHRNCGRLSGKGNSPRERGSEKTEDHMGACSSPQLLPAPLSSFFKTEV
jgi:hypothetical protein